MPVNTQEAPKLTFKLSSSPEMPKIFVTSNKGGVGKTSIAVNLAVALHQKGRKVALFDLDMHGPNVAKMLGMNNAKMMVGEGDVLIPAKWKDGFQVVSLAFMLPSEDTPVIWRGPLKTKAFQQLLEETAWEADVMIVDFPPGTGDESLNAVQKMKNIVGAIIVTTPQEVALQDVFKVISFLRETNVNVLGVVENMSYLVCPHCGNKIYLFGEGGGKKASEKFGVPLLAQVPFDPEALKLMDQGKSPLEEVPESDFSKSITQLAETVSKHL